VPRPLLGVGLALAGGALLGLGATPEPGSELGSAIRPLLTIGALAAGLAALLPLRASRVRYGCLLAALALLSASRGWEERPGGGPGAITEGPLRIGRWQPHGGPSGETGRLARGGERWRVPPGMLAAGETVAAVGPGRTVYLAEGPLGGGGVARVELRADELRRLTGPIPSWLPDPTRHLTGIRERALARMDQLHDPLARGLARALLVGERDGLSPQLADLFTRTGTRHLLALSGLHVGLLAALLAWPLARALSRAAAGLLTSLGIRRHRAPPEPGPLRACLVLAFVPLGGGGAPVARAALCLALAALAPSLPANPGGRPGSGRKVDPLSLWALALGLEVLAHPGAVGQVGVQLSYAATLGLMLGLRGAAALQSGGGTKPTADYRKGHFVRLTLGCQLVLGRLGRGARTTLIASLVASLATLPVVWPRFGEWAPIGILTTPLALPPVAALLFTGWLWTLCPWLIPEALVTSPAHTLVSLLEVADGFPGTPMGLPPRPAWLLLGTAAVTLAILAGWRQRGAARAAAAGLGAALLPWITAPRGLQVVALDVGAGTAVALRAPGAGCWLFDMGSRDRPGVARLALGPLLRAWDVGRLGVVVSHGDRDHAGALDWVLERWPDALWVGSEGTQGHGDPVLDLPSGRLDLVPGGEMRLALLRGGPWEGNEGSRTLEVRFGDRRLLLSGDAEAQGLAAMLEAGLLEGPVDVLLLPHHGSHTPHLAPLLEATQPREVWVSCTGVPPTAAELDRRGLPWLATGVHGWLRTPQDR